MRRARFTEPREYRKLPPLVLSQIKSESQRKQIFGQLMKWSRGACLARQEQFFNAMLVLAKMGPIDEPSAVSAALMSE